MMTQIIFFFEFCSIIKCLFSDEYLSTNYPKSIFLGRKNKSRAPLAEKAVFTYILHAENTCCRPDHPSTVMLCHHMALYEMLHRKTQKSLGQPIIIITHPTRKLNYLRLGGRLD